ncbi:MAG: hypothetical protein GX877_07010 [Bacteroidales bacterium]|nr:hypothetical protein [Bacteroidales bacterium]
MDTSVFYKQYVNAAPQELAPNGYVLQDLVRRYPWFSLGYLLLFKALCGMGGDASLSQSEKTAAYIYSRKKLYFILQQTRKDFETLAEEEFFTLDVPEQEPILDTGAAADKTLSAAADKTLAAAADKTLAAAADKTLAAAADKTQSRSIGTASLSDAGPLEFVLDIPKNRTFYPGADYFGKEQMASVSLDVTTPIDRFISENPRFTQALKRAGENLDTSEQDAPPALKDDEFVTETLAKIYAAQGYHKLAIDCYAKLILLYPEKSAYFASLVEEIKQKSNN